MILIIRKITQVDIIRLPPAMWGHRFAMCNMPACQFYVPKARPYIENKTLGTFAYNHICYLLITNPFVSFVILCSCARKKTKVIYAPTFRLVAYIGFFGILGFNALTIAGMKKYA